MNEKIGKRSKIRYATLSSILATRCFLRFITVWNMLNPQAGCRVNYYHIEMENGENMTLADKLKEARKNAGLTQIELAEKLCVSRQAITKWETGKGIPDVENLMLLSKLLNVSIDFLLDEEEYKRAKGNCRTYGMAYRCTVWYGRAV